MSVIRTLFTRLEKVRALDPVASAIADAVHVTLPSGRVADLLHGRWLGHPAHPLLVQVPIGAWLSASVLDATPNAKVAARRLVGLGLLASPVTAAAGLVDWADLEPEARRVGLVHASFNTAGVLLYLASWQARRRGQHGRGAALSLLGLTTVGIGGALGGHLAYAQASGVNHAEGALRRAGEGWHDLGPIESIPVGRPVRRDAGATPVVVYRRTPEAGGAVFVLAAECAHAGGPLHEGVVIDGPGEPRIECPWHGSVFRLVDGEPLRGPATMCQPRFTSEITAGRLRARTVAEGSHWKVADV